MQKKNKNRIGFAALTKAKRKEVASKGGKASHAYGNGREFTREEAIAAGKKGGATTSKDRKHMSAIGRKGAAKSKKPKEGT